MIDNVFLCTNGKSVIKEVHHVVRMSNSILAFIARGLEVLLQLSKILVRLHQYVEHGFGHLNRRYDVLEAVQKKINGAD